MLAGVEMAMGQGVKIHVFTYACRINQERKDLS